MIETSEKITRKKIKYLLLDELGLENGWVQEYSSKDYYCPDFEKEQPFAG